MLRVERAHISVLHGHQPVYLPSPLPFVSTAAAALLGTQSLVPLLITLHPELQQHPQTCWRDTKALWDTAGHALSQERSVSDLYLSSPCWAGLSVHSQPQQQPWPAPSSLSCLLLVPKCSYLFALGLVRQQVQIYEGT